MFEIPFAQTLKFSDEIKENKNAKFMRTLGADENGNIYLLRSNLSLDTDRDRSGFKNRVYFLQYLNADLKLIWEKELLTSFEDGHIADVQFNNGRVVVVGFLNDRKSKTYTFYIQSLDDKGEWVNKPKEIDKLSSIELDEDDKPGTINSQDELSIAFSYRKISEDKKFQIVSDQSITADGTIKRYPTLKSDKKGYEFMPSLSKQTGSSQIIIPCVYHNNICFAKVDF